MVSRIFFFWLALTASAFAAESKPWIVRSDRENALYQVGETVTFTISANPDAQPAPDPNAEIFWLLRKDGLRDGIIADAAEGMVKLADGKATVTARLDEPGFLQCRVSNQKDGRGNATNSWGVGFSPEKIAPSQPVPDDFDAFWQDKLDALANVPLNPVLTPVPYERIKHIKVFDTRVDCLGEAKVSGYLAKPANAQPKSLPAILLLHGAGVRSSGIPGDWASRGYLAMDLNAHGIDNGKDAAFYKDLADGPLKGYPEFGKETRDGSYFVFMFLRVKRALDFLCAQPEWDGKTLVVYGTSQGGFQAFAGAALDGRVTAMVANIPAGCDHTALLAKRAPGWPRLVPSHDGKPSDPVVLEASRYVDAVNFATRCKAETAVVSVGLVDDVCPPTGGYAAFNALPVKDKTILHGLGAGHFLLKDTSTQVHEILKARVGR